MAQEVKYVRNDRVSKARRMGRPQKSAEIVTYIYETPDGKRHARIVVEGLPHAPRGVERTIASAVGHDTEAELARRFGREAE